MIDICITYNNEFEKLKNICINSLGINSNINLLQNKISTQGDIGFGTNSWYTSLRKKIHFVLETLKTSKNNIVCLSDIDVLYCNTQKLIEDINNFNNTNYTLAACCERLTDYSDHRIKYKPINSGFIIFKKNELNISLLESVLNIDFSNFKFGDQDAINFILKEKNIIILFKSRKIYITMSNKIIRSNQNFTMRFISC